ncbi:MAG: PSD1 and planctomycete cytochrome C domain-containing protein [Bryobacteraceae bacterium]
MLLPRAALFLHAAALFAADGVEVSARKILEAKCISCHGAAKMAGLDLRTADALAKGGGRGPAVVAGKPDASLLMKAVRKAGELKMPPGKDSLSAAEMETLRQWIAEGAKWTGASAAAVPNWWSFRPVTRPAIAAPVKPNPVDHFVWERLKKEGLTPSKPASRAALIRRATFDLHGLPPTPEEITAFVNDTAPEAYEKLLDRLLASPRYGERWGRHWLDVVRYADTGGFETDVYFANAWRYRDYVIRSFNEDKPYNVFVQEQIAGDEIWPDNLDLNGSYEIPKSKLANLEKRIATGLYTLGALPVEDTFFGDQYRAEWQAEAVETTAAAFLGLTFNCARCHDHKFDPITQKDFYRLSAVFAGSEDREVPIVSRMGIYEFTRHQTRWVIAEQLKAKLMRLDAAARARKGPLTPTERDERESLLRQIGDAYIKAPVQVAKANLLMHTEPVPDTYVLSRGDFQQKLDKVRPGFPASLGPAPEIAEPDHNLFIPQRRKALAEWLTSPQHPLTARVMVNRIWQGHFGRGIAGTPNDLGRQGEAPSHPELLDWLAAEFVASNWSVKAMHKQMMMSEAYRFASDGIEPNLAKDPDNRYFWRMNRRRLEAEAIRDSILSVSGVLNTKMFGVPVVAPLAADERDGMRDALQWPISSDPAEYDRRSIYHFVKRSFRSPMMETFDAPDSTASCPRRESSTVAPQSLAMMNGEFFHQQAEQFAARLRKGSDTPEAQVQRAFWLALGRAPSDEERAKALAYLERNSLQKLCLLLFNLSEFLYVD